MSLVFNSQLRAFSMERIASPDSLFCDMVLRKSFLMSFSFEKERSVEGAYENGAYVAEARCNICSQQ